MISSSIYLRSFCQLYAYLSAESSPLSYLASCLNRFAEVLNACILLPAFSSFFLLFRSTGLCSAYLSPLLAKILSFLNFHTTSWRFRWTGRIFLLLLSGWMRSLLVFISIDLSFFISPDSVVSKICALEIGHTIKHNKQRVPVF